LKKYVLPQIELYGDLMKLHKQTRGNKGNQAEYYHKKKLILIPNLWDVSCLMQMEKFGHTGLPSYKVSQRLDQRELLGIQSFPRQTTSGGSVLQEYQHGLATGSKDT
jgi:hypothetical protein